MQCLSPGRQKRLSASEHRKLRPFSHLDSLVEIVRNLNAHNYGMVVLFEGRNWPAERALTFCMENKRAVLVNIILLPSCEGNCTLFCLVGTI